MKANFKGLGGIKGLALAHGEKVAIAVVGVVTLFLVYTSVVGLERLPENRQADRLQGQIQQVSADIANTTWDGLVKEHPDKALMVQPLPPAANRSIPTDPYRIKALNPAVVPPTVLRTDPVLLEAQALEAHGGSGLLAFTSDAIRARRKELERQQEEERQQKQQQKELEKQQKEQDQGPTRTRRTGRGENPTDTGPVDPKHPDRRMVTTTTRPMGVPLQGDEDVRIAYWAVVVAKIPIKEQIKLYRDAFENARGYDPQTDDMPAYLGYIVERAEVRSGQNLEWARVPVYDGKGKLLGSSERPRVSYDILYGGQAAAEGTTGKSGVSADWAVDTPEIVDDRYLGDRVLVYPLPPLVGRDWGKDATHPEVPLASEAGPPDEETKPAAETTVPTATGDEETFEAGGPDAGAGPRGRSLGGRSRGFDERSIRGGPGYGYPGSREVYGRGGERGAYGPGYSGDRAGASLAAPEAPHWLLRFFDFSVQPGKKYKYRVKLVLQDPNQGPGVRTSSLASAVIKRIKDEKAARKAQPPIPFRMTDGSEPSRTVSIPLAGNVKVASASAANDRSFTSEPAVTMLVESFGKDEKGESIQVTKEKEFRRGSVANMTEDAELLVEQGRAIDPVKGFKFRTDITVLDIRGGQRLPGLKDGKRPAIALLMDPAGQLFFQNEMDDVDAVKLYHQVFDKPKPGERGSAGEGVPPYVGREGYPGRGIVEPRGGR